MAHISYIGRNGGKNGELEKAKCEALQLANQLTRVRLDKMKGELVEKKLVAFLVEKSWVLLRERVLQLPGKMVAELRELDRDRARGVRTKFEHIVTAFLTEVSESLEKAVNAESFLDGFDDGADAVETVEQREQRERKHAVANLKRRAKYAAKRKE